MQADKSFEPLRGKGVADLAKSYANQAKLIGVDKIPKPTKDWNDANWAEFWKAGGRPETIEGYKLPEQLPDGITVTPEQSMSPQ